MSSARSRGWGLLLVGAALVAVGAARPAETPSAYAVVVSQQTTADPAWKAVVEALVAKHQGRVLAFSNSVRETLPALRADFPRYVCFVAPPEKVTREYVLEIHRLTRQLDDDPYADCFWGILTGYDAANALRIARTSEPLTIRKVASGTELASSATSSRRGTATWAGACWTTSSSNRAATR